MTKERKFIMNIKRFLALVLALLMVLTLTACTVAEELAYIALDEISQNLDDMAQESYEDYTEDVSLPDETAPPTEEPVSTPEPTAEPAEEPTTEPTAESTATPEPAAEPEPEVPAIDEYGTYTTKEDVALYIHVYGKLPDNFITKKEAEALGWPGGELEPYAPGKCIGGSRFGNYEGLLPDKEGRKWTECDIDTLGAKKRGAKRIVFSNDGLIYYTDDHYESFELLYGEE